MSHQPEEIVSALERALRAEGSRERAEAERRYLRSDLDHIGASVPQVRSAVARELPRTKIRTADELLAAVDALWTRPVHELRLAASVALQRHHRLLAAQHLPAIRVLIGEAGTWAIVDVLADKAAGAIVRRESEAAVGHLERWAVEPDLWVRRSALLATLPSVRAGALPDAFWRYADPLLDDPEWFVRKALGWVLREHARRSPGEVAAWIGPRAARASPVTLREAVKYLAPRDRQAILAGAG
jgi:3-methyladenine DNA glycosylase AlkD